MRRRRTAACADAFAGHGTAARQTEPDVGQRGRIARTGGLRIAAAVLTAAAFSLSLPRTAYAVQTPYTGSGAFEEEDGTGPSLDETPGLAADTTVNGESALTAEEKAALEDDTLEYDEIIKRVERYNSTYRQLRTTLLNSTLQMDAAAALTKEANERLEDALSIKDDDMDAETRALYEGYKEAAQALRKQAQQATNDELSGTYERMLRQTRNQLACVVQRLFVQYQSVEAQTETARKNVEFSALNLEMVEKMRATGGRSDMDVLSARKTLQQAEDTLAQAESGLLNLRQNILILLGWEYNDQVRFETLPQPDAARIHEADLAADTQAAIWANYDRMSIKTESASGSANRSIKKRNVAMSEESIRVRMNQLYQDALAKEQAYLGAEAEYESGRRSWQEAQKKQSLGMLGSLEYKGAELSWAAVQASYKSASLDFFQAIQDYEWAVKGLMTSGEG